MNGFLNVIKPAGITSFAVVARLRRALGVRRVGHLGTLDPAASGVLPIALGRATRLIEYVTGGKAYRAEITLGVCTDTLDAQGKVTATGDCSAITVDEVEQALPGFVGHLAQVPPMASALHHQGRRLYDLFREGRQVELGAREVFIAAVRLVDVSLPRLTLDVECGPGTYVRSLARDLGMRLSCGAHLSGLVRTRSGPFALAEGHSLEEIEARVARGEGIDAWLFPPRRVLGHLPWLELRPSAVSRARDGCRIGLDEVEDSAEAAAFLTNAVIVPAEVDLRAPTGSEATGLCILATPTGEMVAVARVTPHDPSSGPGTIEIRPLKVVAESAEAAASSKGGSS